VDSFERHLRRGVPLFAGTVGFGLCHRFFVFRFPEARLGTVPVLVPYSQQITGVVWAASWRRVIRKGIFHDSPFSNWAFGTGSVSFPKPASIAMGPVDRSHRLGYLRFAIHPPAQFHRSVVVNNFDLIFNTMVVRHMLSPELLPG
jgi:hypothetical protein